MTDHNCGGSQSSFNRFRLLAKRLLAAPKSEVNALRVQEAEQKKRDKAKR